MSMRLRPAQPGDRAALEEIAYAAKAYWGYSPEQLEAWRADLEVSAEALSTDQFCVAEEDGRPVGFAQVATHGRPWELDALWVHPDYIRRGVGRALLAWAAALAASAGQRELAIDADPNAEGFYRACGARVVGSVAAPIAGKPQRVRPQLRLRTGAVQGART